MGGAPYIGPRLGNGPIFDVSVSHLYAKEHPGKIPTLSPVAAATIDFSIIQARLLIKSEGDQLSGQYFTILCR